MAVNRELHFRNLVLFCFGLTVGVKLYWRTRHLKSGGQLTPLTRRLRGHVAQIT